MPSYAVAKGRTPGVYKTWTECSKQIYKFKGAKYKKFDTHLEAEHFINLHNNNQKELDDFIPDYYVYTDGACINNGKKNARAGIGIYLGVGDIRNVSEEIKGERVTNNIAELKAIEKTFEIIKNDVIKNNKKLVIMSDSTYSIRCLSDYGDTQNKNGWKKEIPNRELIKKLYLMYCELGREKVLFKHVKAHTTLTDIHSLGNAEADRLANDAINEKMCPYN